MILGTTTVLFAIVLSACGGGETRSSDRIGVGVIRDCFGDFPPWADASVAGAQLPLLLRGGERAGSELTAGVEGVAIGGRPVELFFACTDNTSYDALIHVRQLVEGEGVDIVIGPTDDTQGIALRDYAKRHPGVTFVNGTSGHQSTTLREPAVNFFSFQTDVAQWSAGLGAYAYHELGWRDAVVIALDFGFPYTEAAGFIAEFCALGGRITDRVFVPSPVESDAFLAELPEGGFDGAFVENAQLLLPLAEQHEAFTGNLADRVVGVILTVASDDIRELGDRMSGVVVAPGAFPGGDSPATPEWDEFASSFREAFPELVAAGEAAGDPDLLVNSLFPVTYFNAMEATLQALEAVGGDLSDGQRRFQEVLAGIELDSPSGRIRLDERRRAIAPNYLMQVQEAAEGEPALRIFRVVEDVEQTFKGYFTPDSPPPSATEPECKHGNPPPWAVANGS